MYPLKFRRKKRKVQPKLRNNREFYSVILGFTKVWGFDGLMVSMMKGAAGNGINSNKRRKHVRKRKQPQKK